MQPWAVALTTVGSIAGSVAVLWPLAIWVEVDVMCEKPKHVVIRYLGGNASWSRGRAELRRYAPMLVAEVALKGPALKENGSYGFRKLAGYIFGGNKAKTSEKSQGIAMTSPVVMTAAPASEKIAMTSPVVMQAAHEGSDSNMPGTMAFMMPSKWSKESLPVPNDSDVRIVEVPSYTAAVLPFRGALKNQLQVDKRVAELRDIMKAEGLEPVGPYQLLQYHPPFAPTWQRRNEVRTVEVVNCLWPSCSASSCIEATSASGWGVIGGTGTTTIFRTPSIIVSGSAALCTGLGPLRYSAASQR